MKLTLYQVDAFASEVFRGNPAAVVPLDAWLPDDTLQAIAMENNLSETAYFIPTPDDHDHDFHLRWFTPGIEAPLCGHATLATAHILRTELGFERESVRFKSLSGALSVRARDGRLALDFPALDRRPAPISPGLTKTIGVEPLEYFDRAPGAIGPGFTMAVLASERQVREAQPSQHDILEHCQGRLIITAPGDSPAVDFVSRFFAPYAGVPEDPVTGSAHCMLAPYWAEMLGKNTLEARQVSPRGGELTCTIDCDRVLIAGRAVTYMHGSITIPD